MSILWNPPGPNGTAAPLHIGLTMCTLTRTIRLKRTPNGVREEVFLFHKELTLSGLMTETETINIPYWNQSGFESRTYSAASQTLIPTKSGSPKLLCLM
jgi:hypothetical protein